MSRYYCCSCGNSLFFRKVIEGTIVIPLEVGDVLKEEEFDVYSVKDFKTRNVYRSYIECGECGSDNIEIEENDTVYLNWEDNDEF